MLIFSALSADTVRCSGDRLADLDTKGFVADILVGTTRDGISLRWSYSETACLWTAEIIPSTKSLPWALTAEGGQYTPTLSIACPPGTPAVWRVGTGEMVPIG